ncbi:putative platelet-derived growth factor receptor beta-like [Scophthalmus maximus]|uniref:receptor protein-tyrosine kinase n=1 Tax=Scophthalmus maximus TaxID=52904 RepID=A0A2U9B720_SCOMX|nr:putative platelet-derived growth factor receptor beta-like [Scophthalmus maximus]
MTPTRYDTNMSLHQHVMTPTRYDTNTSLHQHDITPTRYDTNTSLHQHDITPTRYYTITTTHRPFSSRLKKIKNQINLLTTEKPVCLFTCRLSCTVKHVSVKSTVNSVSVSVCSQSRERPSGCDVSGDTDRFDFSPECLFIPRIQHAVDWSRVQTEPGTCCSVQFVDVTDRRSPSSVCSPPRGLGSLLSLRQVCSGWSQVTWRFPQDSPLDEVVVESRGSSSVLQLVNVTWRNSGRYTCEEMSSHQRRDVDIFIPGRGPDEWFVPLGPGVVMKEAEDATIPCVVSDPKLNVSLFERPGRMPVSRVTYEPGRGFTGRLNDTSYVCLAARGGEERESQVYYVFSIVVPQVMEVDLSVSSSVLRQGEVLTVNCTVTETQRVFFSWDFPRRQEVEPLNDFLPNQIRSFINISMATVADTGVYVCAVQDTMEGRTVTKNITVTVLDQGYVYLWPSGETNVSSLVHHTVEFSVEVDAHPAPTITWTRDNQTAAMETTSVTTTRLMGSRYLSKLTLVRVQMHQTGSYTATASNDDAVEELVFVLEVKAPPRITSLSEVGSKSVLCVSEGAPPPSVTWYTCQNTHRCSNVTGSWRSLSAASRGVTLQENVTEVKERGVTQVRSVLTLQALTSLSAVRCEVKNSAGRRVRDLRVLSPSLLSQVAVLAAVLVLVVIAIFFLIVLIILWRKKPRYESRWKVIESVSPDGQQYTYLDPAHLPYNSTWEIPRDSVVLGQVLGSGAFGRVVEANVSGLIHSHSTTKVFVKMVKPSSGAVQSLMSDLKVLVHLGPHLNVVNLLGACTRGGPVYLITECCRHGDLVNYLQRNKHTFLQSDPHTKSDSDGGYMDMSKEEAAQYVAMKELSCADIEPALYETPCTPADQQEASSLLLSDSPLLNLRDLLSFSYQISQAMDFLSSRNCVHRDLAARNVLVCEGKLVKVCDFGLARDLMKDQDYIARGNSFLPLKWMSPESIVQSIYSAQSDVWSYGVLLWEIFSLGGSPYPDLPMTQEFYSALKNGYRMSRPEHAPNNIFELMTQCWEAEPHSRPTFSSLVVSVGNLFTDEHNERYLQLTENFLKGENPAVVRSRLSLSRAAEDQTDTSHESPAAQVKRMPSEAGSEEAGPSQGTYIIPISDITIETSSDTALDADGLHLSGAPGPQEVMSPEGKQEAVEPPAPSSSRKEEESCL